LTTQGNSFKPAVHIELIKNVLGVIANSRRTDGQSCSNILDGHPPVQKGQHFDFPGCQLVKVFARGGVVSDRFGSMRFRSAYVDEQIFASLINQHQCSDIKLLPFLSSGLKVNLETINQLVIKRLSTNRTALTTAAIAKDIPPGKQFPARPSKRFRFAVTEGFFRRPVPDHDLPFTIHSVRGFAGAEYTFT
jgi:hypothetical protein